MIEETLFKAKKSPRWSFSDDYGEVHFIARYNLNTEYVKYCLSIDNTSFIFIKHFLESIGITIENGMRLQVSSDIYIKLNKYLEEIQVILVQEDKNKLHLVDFFSKNSVLINESYLQYLEKNRLRFYIICMQLQQWFYFHQNEYLPVFETSLTNTKYTSEIFILFD